MDKHGGKGCLALGGLILAGVATLVVVGALVPPDSDSGLDRIEAIVDCHFAVKDVLKAPSTAEFVGRERFARVGGGEYIVHGEVDAQNAFGATLRNDYRCTFQQNNVGQWTVRVDYVR